MTPFHFPDLLYTRPAGSHTIGSKGYGDPYTFDNEYYRALLRRPWLDPKVRKGGDQVTERRLRSKCWHGRAWLPGCGGRGWMWNL